MHITLTYHDLTHHVVPGPQSFSYFVTLLLLPVALLVPRSGLSKWQNVLWFVPTAVSCTIHAWYSMGGVDVISVDVLLWMVFLLVLRDPWKDFKRIRDSRGSSRKAEVGTGLPAVNDEGQLDEQTLLMEPEDRTSSSQPQTHEASFSEQPYPPSLIERLPWVGVLLVSIRLNTWKINSPSHERSQPPPPAFNNRIAFVRHALFCFLRGYLTLDVTRAYLSYDPYFTGTASSISSPLPFSQISFIPPHLLRSMVIGAQAWALIGQMFYLPCLLPVGLHALGLLSDEWSPHIWPPYFGSPRAIFLNGVRGFWGQYWHQTMRWTVAGPGYAIADAFALDKKGFLRYAIITVVAFMLSGIVHMGLVPPEPTNATIPVNRIRLCVAAFFWWQPLAMLLEIVVERLTARYVKYGYWQTTLGSGTKMAINAVWVMAWFALTLPLFGEAGKQLGYWRVWPMPVSLWKGLRGEGWVTWPFLLD